MSTTLSNTNTYSCEQSRLKDQEKSGEGIKNPNSKNQDKQDQKILSKECVDANNSPNKIKENLNQSEQIKERSKDSNASGTKKEGLFSRLGHAFSNAFENAKAIIFPDLGDLEQPAVENEIKIESKKEKEHIKSTKNEGKLVEQVKEKTSKGPEEELKNKIKNEEPTVNQTSKHEKNRPSDIELEGENKPEPYSQSYHDQIKESEKNNPLAGSSSIGKSEDNRERAKEKRLFNEQPIEELSTPIKPEQVLSHESLDRDTVREKLENLNLNVQEAEVEQKQEPINNQNFFQDISNTLQYGDKPAHEEMNVEEKKIPLIKNENLGKDIL